MVVIATTNHIGFTKGKLASGDNCRKSHVGSSYFWTSTHKACFSFLKWHNLLAHSWNSIGSLRYGLEGLSLRLSKLWNWNSIVLSDSWGFFQYKSNRIVVGVCWCKWSVVCPKPMPRWIHSEHDDRFKFHKSQIHQNSWFWYKLRWNSGHDKLVSNLHLLLLGYNDSVHHCEPFHSHGVCCSAK